jgi:GT2 family glycosyltransferase
VASGSLVTLVVPTWNRLEAVHRLLGRIADDSSASSGLEVVIVDDGSTDGTPRSVSEHAWPFPLRVLQQQNLGAAVARNAGARAAAGDILLFLDDDVEPEPGLVAAHVRAHGAGADVVALGDLPPRVAYDTQLGVMLRIWWGEMQASLGRPGHRYSYRDLLSGHFSIRRRDFERLGGFDEGLRCREDYELGYRVVQAGLRLQFVPAAVAWHHDSTDITKAIARKIAEGLADVQLVQLHPPLARSLPLGKGPEHPGLQGRMMRLAWRDARIGGPGARALRALLRPLERLRLRQRWRGALYGLLSYWYWRGVIMGVGTPGRLDALLAPGLATVADPPLVIDLGRGLAAAEHQLDETRPPGVRLMLGEHVVGNVPDLPGAEPLAGVHLRPLLATELRRDYLRALTATGAVPPPLRAAAARASALAAREARRTPAA